MEIAQTPGFLGVVFLHQNVMITMIAHMIYAPRIAAPTLALYALVVRVMLLAPMGTHAPWTHA